MWSAPRPGSTPHHSRARRAVGGVLAATESYRREMDVLDRFVTERCTESPGAKVAAGVLYAAYKVWSDEVG